MKRSTSLFSFWLVFVMCAVLIAPWAGAQSRRGGGGGMRSIRGSGHSIGRSLGGGRSSSRGLEGLGNILGGGRHGSSRSSSRGLEGLGNLFGNGRGAYGDQYDRYGDWFGGRDRRHDEMADAYRDAAIADAVVGVVGIIAGAAGPYGYGAAPYAAPAPVYAPAPQYRVERVLVQEAHYEEYRVWVPDVYDGRTGDMVRGHYEMRRRYVPEVWEERQAPMYR